MDGLCRRWGQRPSQIMREDAQYVLHMLALLEEDKPPAFDDEDEDDEE